MSIKHSLALNLLQIKTLKLTLHLSRCASTLSNFLYREYFTQDLIAVVLISHGIKHPEVKLVSKKRKITESLSAMFLGDTLL